METWFWEFCDAIKVGPWKNPKLAGREVIFKAVFLPLQEETIRCGEEDTQVYEQ
jgi:hypothetical protein